MLMVLAPPVILRLTRFRTAALNMRGKSMPQCSSKCWSSMAVTALQRRILMTYEQCPKVLYSAVTAIEDQHFDEHWGIDFPRMASAAFRNLVKRRITGGASTITMQLAGNLFLDRSDRSFRRKMQEML